LASPPKPQKKDLDKVTTEYGKLYHKEEPRGDPIPVLVAPFPIRDDVPDDEEIAVAVPKMRAGKAAGPSKIRADHLKRWLTEATRSENPDPSRWEVLVELVQECYRTGTIAEEMTWSSMVLLPKGGGDFRGIGLLDIIWKLMESILNRRIASQVEFHDTLHGFRAKRGTGTAVIEAKLIQQLAARRQVPLYEVFLDLRKAYDTLDRQGALEILEGYGGLWRGGRVEGSLRSHMRTQHGEDEAPLQCVEIPTPHEYRFSYVLCHMDGTIVCPVAGCGYLPKSRSVLHRHFANRHPYDSLRIVEEGFLP